MADLSNVRIDNGTALDLIRDNNEFGLLPNKDNFFGSGDTLVQYTEADNVLLTLGKSDFGAITTNDTNTLQGQVDALAYASKRAIQLVASDDGMSVYLAVSKFGQPELIERFYRIGTQTNLEKHEFSDARDEMLVLKSDNIHSIPKPGTVLPDEIPCKKSGSKIDAECANDYVQSAVQFTTDTAAGSAVVNAYNTALVQLLSDFKEQKLTATEIKEFLQKQSAAETATRNFDEAKDRLTTQAAATTIKDVTDIDEGKKPDKKAEKNEELPELPPLDEDIPDGEEPPADL